MCTVTDCGRYSPCRTTGRLTYKDCISRIHRLDGMRGFYKGLSASYYGVSETVIHLVIYESVKARLAEAGSHHGDASLTLSDFLKFMLIGAFSKSLATVITYPHGECARGQARFVVVILHELFSHSQWPLTCMTGTTRLPRYLSMAAGVVVVCRRRSNSSA